MATTMFERQVSRTDADARFTKEQIGRTYPGMAHFAGTSSVLAVCGHCLQFERTGVTNGKGYCHKYREIATNGVKSLRFPSSASACRYFQKRPKAGS